MAMSKQYFEIQSTDNKLLYAGHYDSFAQCLLSALAQKKSLSHADLSYKNLSNIDLDGAHLLQCDFTGTNLSGANMSEGNFSHSRFDAAALYNCCFACSNLHGCSFLNCDFGGTDITECDISHALFSGLSCLTLPFRLCRDTRGCFYKSSDNSLCSMNTPPMVIYGAKTSSAILDHHLIRGNQIARDISPADIRALKRSIYCSLEPSEQHIQSQSQQHV